MGPGLRPYVYRPFPMMMHKAGRPDKGLGANAIIEQRVAESEAQAELLRHEGFRNTPLEALDAFESQQLEFAKLAAEINYDVKKKLSRKAGSEVEAAQAAHSGHMPAVPETPIKKRGRKSVPKES